GIIKISLAEKKAAELKTCLSQQKRIEYYGRFAYIAEAFQESHAFLVFEFRYPRFFAFGGTTEVFLFEFPHLIGIHFVELQIALCFFTADRFFIKKVVPPDKKMNFSKESPVGFLPEECLKIFFRNACRAHIMDFHILHKIFT